MLNAILHIRKLIEQIQMFHKEEISVQEISQITGTDRKTVKKYLEGDPNESCRSNVHGSLERYTDFIIKSIQSGLTQSTIARKLADLGYAGTSTNARQYICKVAYANIVCLSDDDRRVLFRNTADKMGLNDAIVEKELLQILIVSPLVTQLVGY